MIYFTGDIHRDIDIHKLKNKNFTVTKDDYLIILGDFGCVWDGSKQDDYWLDWLEDKPYTVLFVPGNHENYDLLRSYPTEEWHGGIIRRIRPSIIMLERGYVFEIEGNTFFCMGGAVSIDKSYRKEGVSWWADEMPSTDEFNLAYKNLTAHDGKVDYVLTHCARTETNFKMTGDFDSDNLLTDFLSWVSNFIEYKFWLFGHYHNDKLVCWNEMCMYQHIVSLSMIEQYLMSTENVCNGIKE